MQLIKFFTVATALALFLMGCGGTTTTINTNTNTTNTNVANTAPAGNNLEPTKKVDAPTTNDAPTLGPVINAFYDALKRKDAAGVKKVMSQEFIKSTEDGMKEEGKTDIVAFLTEFDKIPENKMETRNEQISGTRGTLEVKGGPYIGWTKMALVNEGGAWKVTNEVPK